MIEVDKMRVSVELALLLQSLTTKNPTFIWCDLKNLLRQEFDRVWQQLDDLKYDWIDSPQVFVNQFICQYSILETKFSKESLPQRDPLIKKKLLRGLPVETHEKLSSFLEVGIPINKFIDSRS